MNPEKYEWLDVTKEIMGIPAELKMLELIKDDEITLEECMQAQEIDDEKMDPKFDISHQHTIAFKLKENLVKLPPNLTIPQIAQICANLFQVEAAVLRGFPLSTTVYQFAYLFDPVIASEDPIMNALSQSVQTLGSHIYAVLKQSCSIKEDDSNISVFSFTSKVKTHDEVMELLIQAEKKMQAQQKTAGQNKKNVQFIVSCLRVRRFLHMLAKSTDISFSPKSQKKIVTDIESARKRLTTLLSLEFEAAELLEGVFFSDLHKTLRGHFGPRNSPLIALKDSLEEIDNFFKQLEVYLPPTNKASEMKSRLEALEARPVNIWARSYLKNSIFLKEDMIFSSFKTEEMLREDINDWVHLRQDIKNHPKFEELVKAAAPVIGESIYRLMGNSYRWHWECSKIYEDFNILIHMANQADAQFTVGNRQLLVCSWFYNYGLNLMIKQILTGFQIQLYHQTEVKYVLYVLENLLGVFERNSQIHLRKTDKTLVPNFMEGNLNKKMKKKMPNENTKKMFVDIFFKKGLKHYFTAFFKLVCVLHNRKLVENPFEEDEELRIKNRFRIFKQIMFVKIIEYEDYRKVLEQIGMREPEFLGEALESLKQAKTIFQNIASQFESNETFYRQREDAQLLAKLSVKASLAVMSLRMGAPNKSFSIDMSGLFPDIVMK